MKTLVNDNAPAIQPGETDLSTFLSGYKEPMKVNAAPVTNGTPAPAPAPVTASPGSNALNNTIQYYRTGKKAGQPRPQKNINTSNQPAPAPPPGNTMQPQGVIQNEMISGALFITLVDLVLPMVIAFVNNKVSKQKISADSLTLTDKQRKDLEPVCDQVVRQLQLSANPVVLLTVSLGGIYAMNFMLQKNLSKK